MSLPTYPSVLTLEQIQAEFGGSAATSLNEYYAGGAYVPSGAMGLPYGNSTAIPTGGLISIANFSGATKTYPAQFFSPGTYYVTVPASTNVVAAYLRGGSGGGGGGGGAGEWNWSSGVAGGGGGGGGGGQQISGAWNVTPGSTITIIVGGGGAGGAGASGNFGANGDSSKYDGYNAPAGNAGGSTIIQGIVGAAGGQGGGGGQGGSGWNGGATSGAPRASAAGGSAGSGYTAGTPGLYAHIPGQYYTSNSFDTSGQSNYSNAPGNTEAGAPGSGQNGGGSGGGGGTWPINNNTGNFPSQRIGVNGNAGADGGVTLQFGTTTPPQNANGIGFTNGAASPAPALDPTDYGVTYTCGGGG